MSAVIPVKGIKDVKFNYADLDLATSQRRVMFLPENDHNINQTGRCQCCTLKSTVGTAHGWIIDGRRDCRDAHAAD